MDPFLSKLFEQAPSVGVLVWCVVHFLRHIEAAEKRNAERDKLWNEAIGNLTEQYQTFHAEQRDRAHEALDRVGAALLRNAAALALAERALSKVDTKE